MSTRPRLIRSVPFWLLIAGSLASTLGGAYLLLDRLGGMDARLTDGTATSNDVYVGQIWAVLGAILVGAGLVGLALALTVGALRSLVPAPVEVVEPAAWDDDADSSLEADAPTADAPEAGSSPADSPAADSLAADEADETTGEADETTGQADAFGYEPELGYDAAKSASTR